MYFYYVWFQVLRQVHSGLSSQQEALEYVEVLMIKLLIGLCSSQPHNKEDVDERISKTFPDPIDKWAIKDAQNAVKDGRKNSKILLPVDKIYLLLKVCNIKKETIFIIDTQIYL